MFDQAGDNTDSPPFWAVFGDLMAGLVGIFVLFFVWTISFQVDLTEDLQEEKRVRSAQAVRLSQLERALAGPIAEGRITLDEGTIGIRGSLLFDLNSADLRLGGDRLLRELVQPLAKYMEGSSELVMISGFTDDLLIHGNGRRFTDNWELSAHRALTVVRALMAAGVPRDRLFVAGFGPNDPAVPNTTEENRAQNRRVEISLVPRHKDRSSS